MGTLAIVLIIVAVILVIIFIFASAGLKKVGKLNIGKIDLSKLADGVYPGEFKGYRWSNQVEVTVKNHQIAGIKIIKDIVFDREIFPKDLRSDYSKAIVADRYSIKCNSD